jgi:hypothetical protein
MWSGHSCPLAVDLVVASILGLLPQTIKPQTIKPQTIKPQTIKPQTIKVKSKRA